MDFSGWSPSHTLIAVCVALTFLGQIIVLLYCAGRLGRRLNKQADDLRKLGNQLQDRIDKGVDDFNRPVIGVRKELSDIRVAINKMSERPIEYLAPDNRVLEHRPQPRKSHSTV